MIVERDLRDAASGGVLADWQYGIAYNAALKLCSILPLILGARPQDDADYLETCRQKRNTVECD